MGVPPLGFPYLETGSCYAGGGGPNCVIFFFTLDFWKHTIRMSSFFNTPRLSGLGNRFVCLYTLLYAGGAIDSTVNFVIDIFFQTFVNGLPDLDTGW